MTYEIVPMQKGHLPEVVALEVLCFRVPWSRESFEHELSNTLANYSVIEHEGAAIGYGGYWSILDEAHITNIAVHPDFQNNRLGTALLTHMLKQAAEKGAHLMSLEVRISNLPARHLYEKLGFSERGRRKAYYSDNGEDAIIMTKEW